MHAPYRLGIVALMLAAGVGCQSAQSTFGHRSEVVYGPKPEEMRKALLDLMDARPEIAIPEFRISLEENSPVERDGIIYIGSWNCDPKLMTFDALFSAPNIPMYEIAGRFEKDNRGLWKAVPRYINKTEKHDVGAFWRASEIEPR